MAAKLYSLYRLYGKRWVRVSDKQLPLKNAKKTWPCLVQLNLFGSTAEYSLRPIPKLELRRQILEKERYGQTARSKN